jgi:hypothetical protein
MVRIEARLADLLQLLQEPVGDDQVAGAIYHSSGRGERAVWESSKYKETVAAIGKEIDTSLDEKKYENTKLLSYRH